MSKADTSALKDLKRDTRRAAKGALRAARDRGKELLREEVPGGARGKLGKGVRHADRLGGAVLESDLIVSAINANDGGEAQLHLPSGKTRKVALRAGPPHDFARDVAEGTGLYGPRGQMIVPLRGTALLIGVDSVSPGEAYLVKGRKKFVVRPRSRGMRPDPYHERAGERLEREAVSIVSDALAEEGLAR